MYLQNFAMEFVYWLTTTVLCTMCSLHCSDAIIGCFVCSSVNGSDPACEDPFNAINASYYHQDCRAGRKGRVGLFPATNCIKVKGELKEKNYTVLIRNCVVDNGDVNEDTEIGRQSYCWMINQIEYEEVRMRGCVLACKTDGCNRGLLLLSAHWTLVIVAPLVLQALSRLFRFVT